MRLLNTVGCCALVVSTSCLVVVAAGGVIRYVLLLESILICPLPSVESRNMKKETKRKFQTRRVSNYMSHHIFLLNISLLTTPIHWIRVPIHKNVHYRQNTRAKAYKTLKKYGHHRRLSPRHFGRQPVIDVENGVEVITSFNVTFCLFFLIALPFTYFFFHFPNILTPYSTLIYSIMEL